jgi:hypothetical protein
MANMNFNLWFQIVELRDVWTEAISELKFKNKLNESLSSELGHWNSAFDSLFKTSGVNWVNLAMSASSGGSVFKRDTEAFATVLGEALTDAYMCMTQGKFLGRKAEKGIEADPNECGATRQAFLGILDKSPEDKGRWFTSVIVTALRRRSEGYSQRSKVVKGKNRGMEYDTYIKTGTRSAGEDDIGRDRDVTKGTVVGSGSIMDTGDDDEVRTLGDESGEATTLMNAIKNQIRSMAGRADDQKTVQALRLLDMISGEELSSLNWQDVQDKLGVGGSTAGRIIDLIRTATEKARKDLGLLSGLRFNRVKKPGGRKRATGGE